MGIATSQQLQNYYDLYRDTEITFTKDILRILNVDPRQIYIKCAGSQWPCIINSTSLMLAKIIVGTKGGAYQSLSKKDIGPVNLRLCFIDADGQPVTFFVTGRVSEIASYMNSGDLAIVTISFTQRPPDDLIEKVGTLLDANSNAIRRREERIILNPDTKRRLGLEKEETIILVQNVPRRCVLRDLSFSGAKIILMGLSKFLQEKETILQIKFSDPVEIVSLKGTVVATNAIEGRQDIIIASIKFDEALVPMPYKLRINNYLTNLRKHMLSINSGDSEEAKKAAEIKAKAAKALAEQKKAEAEAAANAAENQTDAAETPAAETPSAE